MPSGPDHGLDHALQLSIATLSFVRCWGDYMSYSLHSSEGGLYKGLYRGLLQDTLGVIKGDTRNLDYSSYHTFVFQLCRAHRGALTIK